MAVPPVPERTCNCREPRVPSSLHSKPYGHAAAPASWLIAHPLRQGTGLEGSATASLNSKRSVHQSADAVRRRGEGCVAHARTNSAHLQSPHQGDQAPNQPAPLPRPAAPKLRQSKHQQQMPSARVTFMAPRQNFGCRNRILLAPLPAQRGAQGSEFTLAGDPGHPGHRCRTAANHQFLALFNFRQQSGKVCFGFTNLYSSCHGRVSLTDPSSGRSSGSRPVHQIRIVSAGTWSIA